MSDNLKIMQKCKLDLILLHNKTKVEQIYLLFNIITISGVTEEIKGLILKLYV